MDIIDNYMYSPWTIHRSQELTMIRGRKHNLVRHGLDAFATRAAQAWRTFAEQLVASAPLEPLPIRVETERRSRDCGIRPR